ncbi:MAG: alpha/beta fold hydrolase, partial [Oceanisphaera sp.]|nr:alpha/beta fold hydrolase [Oceanisphaera sp.]
MNVAVESPELGRSITAGGYQTNVHEHGEGFPLMLIHGSGPGVTAWANWRLVMPELARQRRVIAPDMLGFGYSERPANPDYQRDVWVEHAIGVLDALGIEQADLVGNSFGGGIALALAIRYPHRVRRLVLMGSVGVSFPITDGLDRVWGYEPSFQTMRSLMDTFAYDRALVTDELAELRYQASIRPGFQESFAQMFPAPRQRWVDGLASNEADIRAILALTGDPAKISDQPHSKGVFESDSTLLMDMIACFNSGIDYAGKPLALKPEPIYPFAVVNSFAKNPKPLQKKMQKKIEHGALGIITQPVYDTENAKQLLDLLEAAKKVSDGKGTELILGIFPITKLRT